MEERKEFKYTIGDKVYYQRKLVMGQVNQLVEIVKVIDEIPENPTVVQLVTAFGDKLMEAVAIILIPADIKLKEKDVEKVIEDIEFEVEPEMVLEVIEDFFDCNPISLLLKKCGEVIGRVGEKLAKENQEVGMDMTKSMSSLPEETH